MTRAEGSADAVLVHCADATAINRVLAVTLKSLSSTPHSSLGHVLSVLNQFTFAL